MGGACNSILPVLVAWAGHCVLRLVGVGPHSRIDAHCRTVCSDKRSCFYIRWLLRWLCAQTTKQRQFLCLQGAQVCCVVYAWPVAGTTWAQTRQVVTWQERPSRAALFHPVVIVTCLKFEVGKTRIHVLPNCIAASKLRRCHHKDCGVVYIVGRPTLRCILIGHA
jgi:hypothetical protein